ARGDGDPVVCRRRRRDALAQARPHRQVHAPRARRRPGRRDERADRPAPPRSPLEARTVPTPPTGGGVTPRLRPAALCYLAFFASAWAISRCALARASASFAAASRLCSSARPCR